MSTPEHGDGLPAETQLPLSQAPRPTETPTQWAPTPGVSSSAVRHPGMPTLPSPESAFTGLLAQLANELFRPAVPSGPAVAMVPQTPQSAGPGLSPAATSSGVQPQPGGGASQTGAPGAVVAQGAPQSESARAGVPHSGVPHDGVPHDGVPHDGVPHSGAPHSGAPHSGVPHSGVPHSGVPHSGVPHSGVPHSGVPHSGVPHSGVPHSGVPHSGVPHSGVPHSGVPHSGVPHSGVAQPSLPQTSLPYVGVPQAALLQGGFSSALPQASLPSSGFAPSPRPSPARGEGDVQRAEASDATHGAASSVAPQHHADSPFSAPLRFDSLGASQLPQFALSPQPSSPHGGEEVGPYWLGPAQPSQTTPAQHRGIFDAHAIRREFPILHQRVNGHRLVWLDNAATTQKPQVVIDRLKHFYEHDNSNIHRAAHTLAARSTDAYEQARETVRRFINAPSKNDVVFVRGTTEGINLIAQTWGRRHVNEGDEVVVSHLEHHANIVPWHRLCAEKKATLRVAPVDDRGQIILEEYEKLLGPRTKLVSFSQVSNALGTITPAREMIELAHRHGAKVLLDGAQAVSHLSVDVQQLDCDFYVFSGHKVFAPTGIGAVFGKAPLLEAMPPWQGGGNMIQDVTFEKVVYQGAPAKFEAGTGNIADAIGLGAALDWLMRIGVENVGRWEHELLEYATPRLLAVPGLRLIGTAPDKAGVLSFTLAGQKTEEVGGLLDKEGIAVRSGHHCAQPILRRFGLEATVRASLAPYNTFEDLDALCAALHRLQAGKPGLAR